MGVQLIGTRSLQLLRSGHYELQDQYEADEVQSLPQNKALPLHSFVERYDLKQLKRNVAALAPMANRAEAKTISVLQDLDSLDVLQLFFYNFWYSRLPDNPSKAWQDYAEILNEVARLYGGPGLQGYESDRGRVYIRYGPPDRVVKAPNEKGALPYEVWFYYQSGLKSNLKFLFFQPGMLSSQMILLNTNIPEEGINPNWKNMILQDPTNPDNKLMHKVFEFFN